MTSWEPNERLKVYCVPYLEYLSIMTVHLSGLSIERLWEKGGEWISGKGVCKRVGSVRYSRPI